MDEAQIEAGRRARRHHVHDLAARHRADIAADPPLGIGQGVQIDDLAGDLFDRAHPVGEVVAGMRGLAGHLDLHEHAALAAGDDAAVGPAGLRVEDRARAPGLLLDQGARGRRADLLVGGEQRDQRAGRAESLEGRQHDGIHREPGLHVAAAGTRAAAVGDAERPPCRLAARIDGVAVAHQQNGACALADGRADAVAVAVIANDVAGDAARGEKAANALAGRVDPGLVQAAAVGVHQRLDQAERRGALVRDPLDHLAFRFRQRRHHALRTTDRPHS